MTTDPPALQFTVPIRVLAGISVPDTPVIARAIELAREHSEPYLFNHVMRSWLFAVRLAQISASIHDEEVLAITAILHDLGLAEDFNGALRFEVEGANAAREFAKREGIDDLRAQLVWDGVALHSTPSIAFHKQAEVALSAGGISLDWGGWGYEQLSPSEIQAVLEVFPRLEMKRQFTCAMCRIVQSRARTTYDNFARDFGVRFVAGYEVPSVVDAFLNAPFLE